MRSLCTAVCFFVLAGVYSDENASNTLISILKSKQIPFSAADESDNFNNIVVEASGAEGADTDKLLVLLAPIGATPELTSPLTWIDNVLVNYIDSLITDRAPYEVMVIFYSDKTHIFNEADFDKIESKEKAVVIMIDIADVPVKIHIQSYKGGKKPPLDIAKTLFKICDNNGISIAFTNLKNTLARSAYDFPFLILGAKKNNSASFRTRMARTENDISKDAMLNMLLEFSDSVMLNPNTDYDTHYLSINFFGIQLFLPSFIWVKLLLFGLPLIFCVIFFKSHSRRP